MTTDESQAGSLVPAVVVSQRSSEACAQPFIEPFAVTCRLYTASIHVCTPGSTRAVDIISLGLQLFTLTEGWSVHGVVYEANIACVLHGSDGLGGIGVYTWAEEGRAHGGAIPRRQGTHE